MLLVCNQLNLVARPSGQNGTTIVPKWHKGTGQSDPTNTIDYTKTSTETNNNATIVASVSSNKLCPAHVKEVYKVKKSNKTNKMWFLGV